MIILLGAVFGLIVGSFVNVVVIRTHAGTSFWTGRSRCPRCGRQIAWYDNLPVLSWLLLKGRCRHCRQPVSPQYPLVELAAAGLLALAAASHPPSDWRGATELGLWMVCLLGLLALSAYDLRWYLLPDKLLLPLFIPAVVLLIVAFSHTHSPSAITHPVLAAGLFGGGFYGLAAVSGGKWMGGGDIKLAALIGLLLGLQKGALALVVAFNAAALIGLILIAMGLKKRRDHIPFGPFLISGLVIAYVGGGTIIDWYVHATGLNLLS